MNKFKKVLVSKLKKKKKTYRNKIINKISKYNKEYKNNTIAGDSTQNTNVSFFYGAEEKLCTFLTFELPLFIG